jgi:hypothetical protein
MTIDIKSKQKALQDAKRDLVKAATQATVNLGKERDRLNAELKRSNVRIKRTREQLRKKAERLAAASKSSAVKTRKELQLQVTKLKKTASAAKEEARNTRKELVLVRRDLADARYRLSHALHIDKAIAKVEKTMAKRKAARKKAA